MELINFDEACSCFCKEVNEFFGKRIGIRVWRFLELKRNSSLNLTNSSIHSAFEEFFFAFLVVDV